MCAAFFNVYTVARSNIRCYLLASTSWSFRQAQITRATWSVHTTSISLISLNTDFIILHWTRALVIRPHQSPSACNDDLGRLLVSNACKCSQLGLMARMIYLLLIQKIWSLLTVEIRKSKHGCRKSRMQIWLIWQLWPQIVHSVLSWFQHLWKTWKIRLVAARFFVSPLKVRSGLPQKILPSACGKFTDVADIALVT